MAAFDLQEQEQIAEIKAWWAQWGKLLITVVVASLVAFVGQYAWKAYQKSQGEAASAAYAAVEKAFQSKDAAKTRAAADTMAQQQPGHALTSRAMFLAAKAAHDGKDLAKARSALEWVVAHSKEEGMVDVASLRLAAVMLDQKQFDAALKVLDKPKSNEFGGQFAEARGDVLAVKGDMPAARKAYERALSLLEKDSPARELIEIKLSSLGAAK
ncbi:YfgM family protein [Chitinimonas sp. PSY-7]|uniref:tetratricopeptide repeat protein n=1 Tax=Chitinimonas sp. PSY-7 TaxID=3459088 RepID=UPI00403FF9D2